MFTEISEFSEYIVVAGNGNDLARYIVKGDKIKELYNKFDRVVYIGKLEGFEIYTCNPETGETGWNIEWVVCVKEALKFYPNFDCIITRDYPTKDIDLVKFYQIEREDYPLREL